MPFIGQAARPALIGRRTPLGAESVAPRNWFAQQLGLQSAGARQTSGDLGSRTYPQTSGTGYLGYGASGTDEGWHYIWLPPSLRGATVRVYLHQFSAAAGTGDAVYQLGHYLMGDGTEQTISQGDLTTVNATVTEPTSAWEFKRVDMGTITTAETDRIFWGHLHRLGDDASDTFDQETGLIFLEFLEDGASSYSPTYAYYRPQGDISTEANHQNMSTQVVPQWGTIGPRYELSNDDADTRREGFQVYWPPGLRGQTVDVTMYFFGRGASAGGIRVNFDYLNYTDGTLMNGSFTTLTTSLTMPATAHEITAASMGQIAIGANDYGMIGEWYRTGTHADDDDNAVGYMLMDFEVAA